MNSQCLRIAILGTRGIPPCYGGFETFAWELSQRLAFRGHRVTVYGRKGYASPGQQSPGLLSVVLPAVRTKHAETVSHAAFSALHVARSGADAALVCNLANAFVLPILRRAGIPAALLVDGFEHRRAKWGMAGRAWYRLNRPLAKRSADFIVADAEIVARHWRQDGGPPVETIAYGVDPARETATDALKRLGLAPGEYFLYVSRLEPENNAHRVIEAFRRTPAAKRLVIVGDAPYADAYIRKLKRAADERVLFTGAIYGREYRQLQAHCFAYIQATEVGGTHPALLEGLAWAPVVVAHDVPEHREVAEDGALYYSYRDDENLARVLRTLLERPSLRSAYRKRALHRLREAYVWDRVVHDYEILLRKMAKSAKGAASP